MPDEERWHFYSRDDKLGVSECSEQGGGRRCRRWRDAIGDGCTNSKEIAEVVEI